MSSTMAGITQTHSRGRPILPADRLAGHDYAEYYDSGIPMQEIADAYGITRQAVSKAIQLYREATVRDAGPA